MPVPVPRDDERLAPFLQQDLDHRGVVALRGEVKWLAPVPVHRVNLRGPSQQALDHVLVSARDRDVQRGTTLVVLGLPVRVHLVD